MKRSELAASPKEIRLFLELNEKERRAFREKSLENLILYAKEKSPYYTELFNDVQWHGDLSLSALPISYPDEFNFDHWNTLGLKKTDLKGKLPGKTAVYAMDIDKKSYPIAATPAGMATQRAILEERILMGLRENKTAIVYPKGKSSFLGKLFHYGKRISKLRANKYFIDAALPVRDILAKLEAAKPQVIFIYPTLAGLLAKAKLRGEIKISPKKIVLYGEYSGNYLKNLLIEAFSCDVQRAYITSEGGILAAECENGHMHICEDWAIIEAVDRDNDFIGYGKKSEKALLTNLWNYASPFIRCDLGDKIVLRESKCACKNSAKQIEVLGKADDYIDFMISSDTIIRILPVSLYELLSPIAEIDLFQIIVHKNEIEFRMQAAPGADKQALFHMVEEPLMGYLYACELRDIHLTLSDEAPAFEDDGRFRYVMQPNREEEITYYIDGEMVTVRRDKHEKD